MNKMDEGSEVIIYIIGGISYEEHTPVFAKNGETKYTVPSFKPCINFGEFESFIDEMNEQDREYKIHFVDPRLKIRYFYTPEGRAFFNTLHDIKANKKFSNVFFHDCHWYEYIENFSIDPSNDYYISTWDDDFENAYDFLNFLELKMYDCLYLKYGLRSFTDIFDAKNYYNIFTSSDGEYLSTNGEKPVEDLESIQWMIENGVQTMKAFIAAGFLERETYVQSAVPCWTLNVESVFTKGVIMEYELFPQKKVIFSEKLSVGKTIQEKFVESADYRYKIADYLSRVLCNLGIRYGLLREVKNPHTVKFDLLLRDLV